MKLFVYDDRGFLSINNAQPDTTERTAPTRRGRGVGLGVSGEFDLTTRINIAARQRRAQISRLRDRALATDNPQLLLQAQRMEDALNAFVEAQTRVLAQAQANAAVGPRTASQPEPTGGAESGAAETTR